MKRIEPPKGLERLLRLLLLERDREAVTGDLYEEFCQEVVPRLGAARARFWYMRQVLSFLPQRLGMALKLLCAFTFLSGTWLGMMDLRLRHPGYLQREWIAGLIAGQAAVTLMVVSRRGPGWLRFVALAGCVGILSLAARALMGVVTGANLEGYILLIALALVVQAALTVMILPRRDGRVARRA
jgi:hypothetical protein